MATGNPALAEEQWVPARLIPTAGMRGQQEQEQRATSALLGVLPVVPEFAHALLADTKAQKGTVSAYTEVRLKDEDKKVHIPDGAIVVTRGKKRWSYLVEVKTGRAMLEPEQVTRYLDMARLHGFDGVITISNQIRGEVDALPYEIDKRKLRGMDVLHLSWWRILTEAIVQHRFKGVSDPEQGWLLNELIRFLDDERSGAGGFDGMGEEWTAVREGARNETLRAADPQTKAVAARWEQFVEYLCLHLSQELGVEVEHKRPRNKSAPERVADTARVLAEQGVLQDAFKVPDAVGPVTLEANLRTRQVSASAELDAPKDRKRATARVNWLLRQLRDAPDDLRIEVRFTQTGSTCSGLLRDCREEPERLLLPDDPKREPRSFVLTQTAPMGRKRGLSKGSFVAEARRLASNFYRDLVQDLTPPRPKAPKMAEKEAAEKGPADRKQPSEGQARREQERTLDEVAGLTPFLPR